MDFYKAIILMLEFIVIMEVVKMISDFIKKETLRLRYVIDIFIIFLIRDVIILTTNKSRDYFDILSALRRLEKIADRAVSIANLLHFAQVGGDMVQS